MDNTTFCVILGLILFLVVILPPLLIEQRSATQIEVATALASMAILFSLGSIASNWELKSKYEKPNNNQVKQE